MADQEEVKLDDLDRSPNVSPKVAFYGQKEDRWATAVGPRTSNSQPEEGDKPNGDNGDKKEKGEKPRPASLIKLFRYATFLDWLLMFIGAFTAVCHGAALPSLMLIFGDLTNSFINQATSRELYNSLLNNDSVDCGFRLATSGFYNVGGIISSDCPLMITNTTTFENALTQCFSSEVNCLNNDDFIDEINLQIWTFVGIGVGVFIAANLQIALFQIACERQTHKIQLNFYRAILRQNIAWFDSTPSGELASRLTDDINKIHDGIGDKVALLIQWVAVFFGGFIVGFVKEWRLTLLLLAFTPFLALAGAIMTKVISTFTSQEQKQYASAGAVAEEVLSSIRTVVAFGGEYKEQERYNVRLNEARKLGGKKGAYVGFSFGFLFFLIFIVDAAAFWFGAYLISEEITQGGDVITVFFAVLIGAFALGQGAPNLQNLLQAAGAAGTIYDIIDREPPIDSSSEEGLVLDKFDGTVEFNNVSFSYPSRPNVQVMSRLSLKVDVGQTVALVGPSGCGKSTVIQLLQRFYDLDGGEILVSGKDVQSLNLKWLRSNIGIVSQEPVLFDTTIAENIRYGAENATMEEIKEAAANANAHKFISQLPDGYNTLVGERGTQLSGGQKQRIAIARALVRDPKILLLDEATSALDTESEAVVQAALDHAREGRTTIVIAHRLSTIQQADVIASIEDGTIVEMGTHAELMDNKGLYYELVTAQSYATDEAYVGRGLGRLVSRNRSVREGGDPAIQKQISLQKQASMTSDGKPEEKEKISEKQQEEWDKEIPEVSLWRVIKVNAKEWWIIILGLLGAAVSGSIWPLFGVLFGEYLDVFALPADEVVDESHLWGGLLILLGIVSGLGVFTRTVCFSVSGEYLTTRLRSRAFKAMLRQEIGWHDNERNSTGILTTRLANDAGQVQGATGTRLGTLVETFFGMIVAIVIAFAYSWVLTLLILGVVPIMIVAGFLEVRALTGHAASNKKALEDAGKVAVESIANIRTVASLGVEDSFFKQYRDNIKKPYRRSLLNTFIYGMTYAISQSTIYLMYAVVFRFGAFQVIQDRDDIAYEEFDKVFTVFTALIFGAVAVGEAGAFAPNYAKARLSANRIFSLLDRELEIDGYSEEGITVETVVGEIGVKDVEFSYPARPQVKVLQRLSVSVVPGHSLALVGPSGCGKSTIVSLVERFYDPDAGNLTLDGNDLKVLNIRWLRSQIGIVSQEPVLFDTSIAENIRYGANYRQVSDEEVIEAAKAANIHGFIDSLPQGYSTNVGAKGTQLSGGQKQRIAIARALVRDPQILLLDEATSALDTESEKIVQEALDKAREGRTSIVIAHRLSTIYNADCIAVIKDGQVAEIGTHSELISKRGIYFNLNRFQMMDSGEGGEETK